MRKYTKKEKKSLNSEKEEKRRALGQQLRDEIDKRFKTYTEFREACTEHSNYAGNSSGNEYISAQHLSNLMSGESPISPDKAEVFSQVLGLPVTYILGYDKYPSEEARKKAEKKEAEKEWNNEDIERISTFKKVMSMLSDKQYIFCFELKEEYEFISSFTQKKCTAHAQMRCNNMQYTLIDNGTQIIPESEFFSWLTNNTGTIKHSSNKWYHLNNRIQIMDNNDKWMELDINKFMIMIYDIDESIKATVQNRCDFWMKYANYDHKEALRKEIYIISPLS